MIEPLEMIITVMNVSVEMIKKGPIEMVVIATNGPIEKGQKKNDWENKTMAH